MTLPSATDTDQSVFLRETAVSAAQHVQDQLISAFRSTMEIEFKKDRRDIVTAHDKAAEIAICSHLQARVPDSAFVGEEGGRQGEGSIHWYIDPIDGTANFARGLPSWCVSIGAVRNDEIVAGAIVDPMGGNVFSADLNGAYHGNDPLRSSAHPEEAMATILCSYPSARDIKQDGREIALDRFGTLVETYSAVRRNGSAALGLAHVAAGWADAAAGFSISPWDVTAAIMILRQAGGSYVPVGFGQTPGSADHLFPGYVAVGAGATYPTLSGVAADIAAGRQT